jgi:hypothetical protein
MAMANRSSRTAIEEHGTLLQSAGHPGMPGTTLARIGRMSQQNAVNLLLDNRFEQKRTRTQQSIKRKRRKKNIMTQKICKTKLVNYALAG